MAIGRLAAALALLCGPAWAETVKSGGDTIELRDSEKNIAEVFYSNSAGWRSLGGRYVMTHNGVEVEVIVEVNVRHSAFERITVIPTDPAFVAIPADAEVADGETVTIQIMQPMF